MQDSGLSQEKSTKSSSDAGHNGSDIATAGRHTGRGLLGWQRLAVLLVVSAMLVLIFDIPGRWNSSLNGNIGEEYITFGRTVTTSRGEQTPIVWRVLNQENGKMLVVSKDILDCRPFEQTSNHSGWNNSSSQFYLNVTLYNHIFNNHERKHIIATVLPDAGADCPPQLLFFPSQEEIAKYLPSPESRRAKPNTYSQRKLAYCDANGYGVWWLRTSAPDDTGMMCVDSNGNFVSSQEAQAVFGEGKQRGGVGLRVAMYLDLTAAGVKILEQEADDKRHELERATLPVAYSRDLAE